MRFILFDILQKILLNLFQKGIGKPNFNYVKNFEYSKYDNDFYIKLIKRCSSPKKELLTFCVIGVKLAPYLLYN